MLDGALHIYISKLLGNAICLEFAPNHYPSKLITSLMKPSLLAKVQMRLSYLYHYFNSDNSVKCNDLNFHCDNCRGQNKNNAVVQYLCYRTLMGLNSNNELSFTLPYHTRFGPNWCFGLVKLKCKHSYMFCFTISGSSFTIYNQRD